jgi:DNA-binding XRE family transcriptional regulator
VFGLGEDVVTSGATSAEASRALFRAGAADVLVVTVARAAAPGRVRTARCALPAAKVGLAPFHGARRRIDVVPTESVRILRELQRYTQTELAARCSIPQSTISAIEIGCVNLGVERAKAVARSLRCHPAVLSQPVAIWTDAIHGGH